jgi:hypothetical protein
MQMHLCLHRFPNNLIRPAQLLRIIIAPLNQLTRPMTYTSHVIAPVAFFQVEVGDGLLGTRLQLRLKRDGACVMCDRLIDRDYF